MAKARRSSVQKYHDRVAGRYDQTYDDAFWAWHDSLTWDYLKPFLPRDHTARVCDFGCGTGKWGAKLIKSGYAVTCVDISPQMLDQARRKIDPLNRSHRAVYLQADLCDLSSLLQREFALAIAFGEPIGCSDSPAKALKQIRRTLCDDGVLVATLDNRLAGIDYYLSKGDRRALARFLRDGKTNWLTKDTDERFPIHTYSPSDVRSLLDTVGFELLDMVGKTVLPMRHYRSLLETPEDRRSWAKIEKSLCRSPDAMGRAAHLQFACRVAER